MNHENKRQPVYFILEGGASLYRFSPSLYDDEWNVFEHLGSGWGLTHSMFFAFGSLEEWAENKKKNIVAILKEKKVVYYLRSGRNYLYRAWETPDDFYCWVMVDVWLDGVWSGIQAYDNWEEWERYAGPEIAAIIHKRGKLST